MLRCSSTPPVRLQRLSKRFRAGSRKRPYEQCDQEDTSSAPESGEARGPLDLATAWIGAEEQREQTFVLLAHEILFDAERPERGGYREYEAIEVQTLADSYAGRSIACARRNAHEVIHGPCKLYIDAEFSTITNPDANGPAMVAQLIEVLLDELQEQFGVQGVVALLDASKPAKFSQHVTIELDQCHTAFATNRHCGAFIAACYQKHFPDMTVWDPKGAERIPVYDLGVYARRHPIRLYGSTKCSEPSRPFRRLDAAEPTSGPFDRQYFLRSLITAPMQRDCRLLSSPDVDTKMRLMPARRGGPIRRSPGNAYNPAPESLVALVYMVPQMSMYEPPPHKIKMREDSLYLCVGTNCKDCPIYGGRHDTQRIYFTVDLVRGRFRGQCHSDDCAHLVKAQPWTDIDTAAKLEIERFMQTEWAGGKRSSSEDLQKIHTLMPLVGDFID